MCRRTLVLHVALQVVLATGLVAVQSTTSGGARAVPVYGATEGGPSVRLSNSDGNSPYNGIVRYFGRATCTGVFVTSLHDDQEAGDAPAYVLTNGHCPAFPSTNQVIVDVAAASNHRVVFNYFADTTSGQIVAPVARTAYATMKGRDVAVLELATRYRDVRRAGIKPWPISLTVPMPDEPVAAIGAPLTGSTESSFLRLATCRLESRARVVFEFNWHWFDYYRNRCADISPGSSGSPVISRDTGRLLGLMSTTTADAFPFTDCFLNHPCEPAREDDGVAVWPETSYMTSVVRMDRCFDGVGRFNVQLRDCPLDPGVQIETQPSVLSAVNPRHEVTPLGSPRRRWDVAVSGDFPYYRYKIVAASTDDCRDLRGYGEAWRVIDRPVITDTLPLVDGYHMLCLLGGANSRWGSVWQQADHPTAVTVRIDTIPPRIPAPLSVIEADSTWRITFDTIIPEISGYTFKVGRPSDTYCQLPRDYQLALIPFLTLPKDRGPYVFCAIPHDQAFNQGAIIEAVLP